MNIFVFNKNLKIEGLIDSFISLRWVKRYYQAGEFELHCLLTKENIKILIEDNILYKEDDTEAAVIEYINLRKNQKGEEIIIVKGRTLSCYFERRIIWGTEIIYTTSEKAMRKIVENNSINPTDLKRKIPFLELAELKGIQDKIDYQVSYKNLYEELEKISSLCHVGFRVHLDILNKKLIFEVYKGKDRSINQNINNKVIFSKEYENILEQEYTSSINNYRNIVLVAGAGEKEERKSTVIGEIETEGLERYELYIDARDIEDKKTENDIEVEIPHEEYIKLLENRGKEKLIQYNRVESFDNKININNELDYKENFQLGDIVTCISQNWNLTVDTRITEIEEIIEENERAINISLGDNVPSLLSKIKQLINN